MYTCGSIRPKPYRLDTRWRKVILTTGGNPGGVSIGFGLGKDFADYTGYAFGHGALESCERPRVAKSG
jgi:hypothetical protein